MAVRRQVGRGVTVRAVSDDGLQGVFVALRGARDLPGVVLLGGTEGGVAAHQATLLASHGYGVLALGYIKMAGLPAEPVRLPVGYLLKGLDWLASQAEVDADRVGASGGSKGGEAALLLGTVSGRIRAVVAENSMTVLSAARAVDPDSAPWTYQGGALPYVRPTTGDRLRHYRAVWRMLGETRGAPSRISHARLVEMGLGDPAEREAAAIPVERIGGPILFITGEDDQMVPSADMAEAAMARLARENHPWPDRHLRLADAGHVIGLPNLPVPPEVIPVKATPGIARLIKHLPAVNEAPLGYKRIGGTPEGCARAAPHGLAGDPRLPRAGPIRPGSPCRGVRGCGQIDENQPVPGRSRRRVRREAQLPTALSAEPQCRCSSSL